MARYSDDSVGGAAQAIQNEPVGFLDMDSVVKTFNDFQKIRDDKTKADQEYNTKLGDLDIKAKYYGFGGAQEDSRTGKIVIGGQQGGVPPIALGQLAYGLSQQGMDPNQIQQLMQGLSPTGVDPLAGLPSGVNVAPKDRANFMKQQYQVSQDVMDRGMKLRDTLKDDPRVTDFRVIEPLVASSRTTLDDIESGQVKNFIGVDQALIKALARITDPRTGVRDFEQLQTIGGQSALDRLRGFKEKLEKGGQGLTLDSRKAIVDQIELIGDTYADRYNTAVDAQVETAKAFGVPDKLVKSGIGTARKARYSDEAAVEAAKKSGALKPGDIVKIGSRKARVK